MENKNPKIIVVTGAESTGKSTLAKELAKQLGAKYYPEYARGYISALNHPYSFEDVKNIAKEQIKQYEEAKESKSPWIILDTWLLITLIWMDVVFQQRPKWLTDYIENAKIDLFLVCDTSIPWEDDPVRENGGKMREELQKKYVDEIMQNLFPYEIVSGIGKQRTANALSFLKKL